VRSPLAAPASLPPLPAPCAAPDAGSGAEYRLQPLHPESTLGAAAEAGAASSPGPCHGSSSSSGGGSNSTSRALSPGDIPATVAEVYRCGTGSARFKYICIARLCCCSKASGCCQRASRPQATAFLRRPCCHLACFVPYRCVVAPYAWYISILQDSHGSAALCGSWPPWDACAAA
jgi:hypothetical protein